MAIVCIDTQVLIWGIQRVAREGQEDMLLRTRAVLEQLEKERAIVTVPAIVIGEFLINIPEDEAARYQEIINRQFVVVPFDLRASIHFARIWQMKRDAEVLAELARTGKTRTALRADVMIIATALAANATTIYGNDKGMARLSEDVISFQNIADVPVQATLPMDLPEQP